MDQSRLEQADKLRYDGEYDAAQAIYDELLAASADDPEAYRIYYGRGLCLCFSGFFDESIAELEKCVELAPEWIKGLEDMFKTYLMLGMNDEAIATMRKLFTLDPGNEEAHKAAVYFPGEFDDLL